MQRVLQKLAVAQLAKIFPAIYATQSFIAIFTRPCTIFCATFRNMLCFTLRSCREPGFAQSIHSKLHFVNIMSVPSSSVHLSAPSILKLRKLFSRSPHSYFTLYLYTALTNGACFSTICCNTKLLALSPQANYIDRATAPCRRS
jgi:hypothetical protein